jgi:hypothetical protein
MEPQELKTFYSKLVSDANKDPDLKRRLQDDPKAVVQERGLSPEEHEKFMQKIKQLPHAAFLDSICCCQGGILSIPSI